LIAAERPFLESARAFLGRAWLACGDGDWKQLAWNLHRAALNEAKGNAMNRHQQRAALLFGLLLISAALLGRANSSEAQAHAGADRGLVLTLGDLGFDAGKVALQPTSMTAIDRLAQLMGVYPERSVRIEGHTDSLGDDAANQQLSERRANAVRDALLARGIDAARVEAVGYGETRPIADNATPVGRQKNRRIEIVLTGEHTIDNGVAHNAQ
jgi:outer membrane protein OmpA-like peptidoglycan-associated protein